MAANPSDAVHWLLPVDPLSHREHLPADWRTTPEATMVWRAIGRTQAIERWCLRSGYRTMQAGDRIWAYLSGRQQLCAVGSVRAVVHEDSGWFVLIDWDDVRTAELCRAPISRDEFAQIPMSTCRARAEVATMLSGWLESHPS